MAEPTGSFYMDMKNRRIETGYPRIEKYQGRQLKNASKAEMREIINYLVYQNNHTRTMFLKLKLKEIRAWRRKVKREAQKNAAAAED